MRLVCAFQQYPYVCRPLKWQGGNTSPSHFNNLLFQLPERKKKLPKENQTRSTVDPPLFKVWWTPSELIRNCRREKWKTAAKIIFRMTTIFILWWLKWCWTICVKMLSQLNTICRIVPSNFGVVWMSLEIAPEMMRKHITFLKWLVPKDGEGEVRAGGKKWSLEWSERGDNIVLIEIRFSMTNRGGLLTRGKWEKLITDA